MARRRFVTRTMRGRRPLRTRLWTANVNNQQLCGTGAPVSFDQTPSSPYSTIAAFASSEPTLVRIRGCLHFNCGGGLIQEPRVDEVDIYKVYAAITVGLAQTVHAPFDPSNATHMADDDVVWSCMDGALWEIQYSTGSTNVDINAWRMDHGFRFDVDVKSKRRLDDQDRVFLHVRNLSTAGHDLFASWILRYLYLLS